jgi:hypothetical protein
MPREVCPVKGFEMVAITFPDEWLIEDNEKFWSAYREAGEQASQNTALFYGCAAVCSQIEGLPETPIQKWPLQVYAWVIRTVYYNGLEKALNPEKN